MDVSAWPYLGKLSEEGISFHEPIWKGFNFSPDGEHIEDALFLPKKWHHLCLSFNANFKTINVVLVSSTIHQTSMF